MIQSWIFLVQLQLNTPKTPSYFFKMLGLKLASHRSPGGLPSVSTYNIVG